jgi:hypothetical protein
MPSVAWLDLLQIECSPVEAGRMPKLAVETYSREMQRGARRDNTDVV